MDYDGIMLSEYISNFLPAVNDTVLLENNSVFVVQSRHFSTSNSSVLLLGEIETTDSEK